MPLEGDLNQSVDRIDGIFVAFTTRPVRVSKSLGGQKIQGKTGILGPKLLDLSKCTRSLERDVLQCLEFTLMRGYRDEQGRISGRDRV